MLNASLENTLAERKSRYGTFEGHAALAQQLKRTMQTGTSWPALADDQKECLEMVMHKVARILNGDPNYVDSWHDILGYVKLIENRLQGPPEPEPPVNIVSINAPIRTGPYCNWCETELADFRKDNGKHLPPFYWCSDCACECDVDTSDMTLMGQAG